MCNSAYDKIHSIKYRTHMQNIILWYIRYAIRFAIFIFAPFLFFCPVHMVEFTYDKNSSLSHEVVVRNKKNYDWQMANSV